MRILIVTQYFWPEDFRINDLALGLKARGCDVTVLTGKPNYPAGTFFKGYGFFRPFFERFQGIPVWRVPIIPRGQGRGLLLALNYASFVLSGVLLAPFLYRARPDIILAYQVSPITAALPAILLRKLRRAPLLMWILDIWPESLIATGAVRSLRIVGWVDRLVRAIYRRCDRILLASRAFADSVREKGVAPEKLLYFPNSAETLYRPVAVPPDAPERRLIPSGFIVMFAGNIGAAQDFETILAAAEQLKTQSGIHWVILGDGRRRAWVENEVAARNLQATVHLPGRFPADTMPSFFALADALLVTLRKEPIFALTIPGKIQSYLACARPVVAALDGEGSRVIHEARAGLTVPAGDAAALAEAVRQMAEMPREQLREMGRNGRAYFEQHFDRERLLDRLLQWMKDPALGP